MVSAKKLSILLLVALLASSAFLCQSVRAQQPQTLANQLSVVSGEIGSFQSGLEELAVGLQFGDVSMAQVNAYVASLTDPLQYMEAVCEFSTLNGFVVDETKMEWALDSVSMMSNGLPETTTVPDTNTPAFFLYDRYVLVGYQYALEYNYDLGKWNLTLAYNSFHQSLMHYGVGLYISVNGISTNNERYYDEFSETMQVFLFFYEMGISQAMIDANTLWQWVNSNLWLPTEIEITSTYAVETIPAHYEYSGGFECEAGSFYQIIMLYHYLNPSANVTNVLTDASNRFLNNDWNSPQWSTVNGVPSYNYVTVHQYPSNPELRLENTLTAWSSLNGLYLELNNTSQTDFRNMLQGCYNFLPAWQGLLSSKLYLSGSGFMLHSDSGGVSDQATAIGLNLLLLEGIVPGTGSLAIPLNDWYYEDTFATMDADLYAFNFANATLTFSVLNNGTFTFLYGSTPITQCFNSSGVYQVTFSSDYNNIINVEYLLALPSNRIYMTSTTSNLPEYSNQTEGFSPFGSVTAPSQPSQGPTATNTPAPTSTPTSTPVPLASPSPSPETTGSPTASPSPSTLNQKTVGFNVSAEALPLAGAALLIIAVACVLLVLARKKKSK